MIITALTPKIVWRKNMKHFSKILSAVMAVLMIASGSTAAVSAATVKPCAQVRVICNGAKCDSIGEFLKQYCVSINCKYNEIIKYIDNYCPGGNCNNLKPSEPVVTPTKPVEEPSETVAPTEPLQKPTEPVAVATEPAEKPTEPVVTPTEPTAAAQTEESEFNTEYEAEVLRLVNIERGKYGLSPLAMDSKLTEVAHIRAKEIVINFSHTRPNGSTCFTAAKEMGVVYRSAGENIAYGYPSPQSVVNGWMNSEGHRKNILSQSFGKIGIGCYKNGRTLYWSQFFTD